VLARPYDTTFLFYESMSDSRQMSADDVLEWLTRCLSQHIHTVSSVSELQHDWLDSRANTRHTEQVNVIVCFNDSLSSTSTTPLFISVLNVVLDSRVRFARVARSIAAQAITLPQQQMSVVISTAELVYIYGGGDADCMTLASVRLLLQLLAPSAASLLDVAITLSLLLLSLEPCLVVSGLKSRLLGFMTFSFQLCFVFLLYCFFVSYVLPEHELHLLLDGLLPVWRYIILTSFGDLVRSDWLRYTTINFDSFVTAYFMYLLLVAWFYRRLCWQKKAWLSLYWNNVVEEDENREYIDWYTWQQFGVPDFWLESQDRCPASVSDTLEASSRSNNINICARCERPLSFGCKVCRLTCQHVFHRSCLADLVCCHDCVCPACNNSVFADTALNEFSPAADTVTNY